jgi:transcription elongation factor GreA
MFTEEKQTVLITKEKYADFEKELTDRKTKTRKAISVRLITAKDLGDLKENAEYHTARDDQGKNESRIQQIEEILRIAQIISKPKAGGEVSLGSVVTIQKEGVDATREYTVVDPEEADMATGKISIKSPIGSVLIGQSKNARVEVVTPGGIAEYTIISVM